MRKLAEKPKGVRRVGRDICVGSMMDVIHTIQGLLARLMSGWIRPRLHHVLGVHVLDG